MKIPAVVLLCLFALPSIAGLPQPEIAVLAPPDGFFVSQETLDVVVSYEAPKGKAGVFLRLLVNGLEVAQTRTPAGDESGTHVFRVPIDGPVALLQVVAGRGDKAKAPIGPSVAIRGAGLAEFQLLRATMEEMEEISTAILQYSGFLNYRVPSVLGVLVPGFLPAVPSHSPLGPEYEYSTDGHHFRIRVSLPGQGEILIEDGTFTEMPPGAITDREATRLIREQLRGMASAAESYRVDTNVYPQRLEDLVPTFSRGLPSVDPYGNPYAVALEPEAYHMVSFGRDGEPGGTGFDADTVMETGVFLSESTSYRGYHEYMDKAATNLTWLYRAIRHVAEQTGSLPGTLAEVEFFVGRGATFDLCGNPYQYLVRDHVHVDGTQSFFLSANGCDGLPQTDSAEPGASGVHPPACFSRQPLLLPLQFPGLFD